jgi:predicted AlkP superfamily phosphohydrolase/phosphomutase/tetratricopeptide (TPR) repeat protein
MAADKVLLVGWDAADWKVIHPLIDLGKMPNVQHLVEHGASGQLATLRPPLSPMLWTSIATGKRPFKHGIHGFSEPTPDGSGVQPITCLSRKSKALWNILHQNHLRSIVIGWWPGHPAEPIDGVMVSDQYNRAGGLLADTVHPPELAETLAGLRIQPDLLTPQMVEAFVPLAGDIDQNRDQRLTLLLRTLAECMSIEAAAIWLLDHQPWDFFAVYLDSIDHFCHGFMKYHPPRQSWIGERDFELYHNVVSMAYQFHDRMLGILLDKVGADATVMLISDHGFHPDHLRPASIPDIPAGPAVEHRDAGILAISGPGIRRGEVLFGPSVLDIAPTILTIYGLPAGEDMDGKVLSQAFARAPQLSSIPSWEEVPGPDGRHPAERRLDPVAAHEALERMIALGYVERPDEDGEVAVAKTLRELRYNLGEAFQDDARHREAHEIFAELYAADPDEQRFAVRLFVSCQALDMHEDMRSIVDNLDGRRRALFEEAGKRIEALLTAGIERVHERKEPGAGPETMLSEDEQRELARWRNLARYQAPVVDFLKAQVLMAEKRYDEALASLDRVTEADRSGSMAAADLYLRLGRSSDAREVYEHALAIDPDNAHAHLGMCRVALRRRDFSGAAQSALDALESSYSDPFAHFLLGLALAGLKQYQGSAEAFRAAISLNPNFPEAHVRLGRLLQRHLGDPASAREHQFLARRMKERRSTRTVFLKS